MKTIMTMAAVSLMALNAQALCRVTRADKVICLKPKTLVCKSQNANLGINLGEAAGTTPQGFLSYNLNVLSVNNINIAHASSELGYHRISVDYNHVQLVNPQGDVDFEFASEVSVSGGKVKLKGLYIKDFYSSFDPQQLNNDWQCVQD